MSMKRTKYKPVLMSNKRKSRISRAFGTPGAGKKNRIKKDD